MEVTINSRKNSSVSDLLTSIEIITIFCKLNTDLQCDFHEIIVEKYFLVKNLG
jgi:hypothetical protein